MDKCTFVPNKGRRRAHGLRPGIVGSSSLGLSKQLAVSIYRNEEAGSEAEIVDVSLMKRD